ncbi:MAG TPA: SsrA-binding protein SmpB [Gemmatimonadaceae bacterium]|nr:SsrA-binding protein SmpB [Gemmatimonadaceae bacterium]
MPKPSQPPVGRDAVHVIARNKRARFDYEILEQWEAGIVLTGTEVKSLRAGRATINDAFGVVKDGEVWLLNMHVPPYEQGNQFNHDPVRTRKLLLHRREVRRLIGAVERQGLTLVALELYFKGSHAKVRLGLGRGKKVHDKRETLRRREGEREIARALKVR